MEEVGGREMSTWADALGSLDDRAKSGKTASVLIEAAQEEIDTLRERVDNMAKHGRDREAELEAAQKQLRELKEPKLTRSVSNDIVEFKFSPNRKRGRADNTWMLDEMESALTHLRLCGAQDSAEIDVYGGNMLSAQTTADQAHEALGWAFKAPDYVISETCAKANATVVRQPRRGISPLAFFVTAATSWMGGMAMSIFLDLIAPLF